MKAGFTLSIIAHIVILAILLVSFYVPQPPTAQQTEEVPISLVPLGEVMSVKQGEKQPSPGKKPSPRPTRKPDVKVAAENIGDADMDTNRPVKPQEKQRAVKAPPPAKGEPEGKTDPAPAAPPAEPAKAAEAAPPAEIEKPQPPQAAPVAPPPAAPRPAEPAALAAPVDDIGDFLKSAEAEKLKAEKPEQSKAPEPAKAQEEPVKPNAPVLPTKAPLPVKRPESELKKPEKAPAETAKNKGDKDGTETADNRNALIDRTRTRGGGAKRSQGEAGQGAAKTIGDQDNLQQSLNNIIGSCVARNWDIGVVQGSSAYDLRVQMHFRLKPDGSLASEPDLTPAGGDLKDREVIALQARAALKKCAPFKQLPAEAYDKWRDVTVNMKAFSD